MERRTPLATGLAATAGLLLYAASPGRHELPWLAWVALVPLFVSLRDASAGQAFFRGLVCGLFFYIPLLPWITTVLATYGGIPFSQAVAVMLLLACYMSLYPALFSVLLKKTGLPLLWAAPVLWVALDTVRGWLRTGFPWMDLAYSLYHYPALLQTAAIAGHRGITFLLVLTNAMLFEIICTRRRSASLATAALLLASATAFSVIRYHGADRLLAGSRTLAVAVVQGNIDQSSKWLPSQVQRTVQRYFDLTGRALQDGAMDLVVWPETALPFAPDRAPDFQKALALLLQPTGAFLLTGVPWEEPGPTYYNRAVLLGPQAKTAGFYDKRHLVPFGEYIPLRDFLPISSPVVDTMADFSAGRSSAPITCGTAHLGVLICFESIFPQLARQEVRRGADLLVNITNDAWFGDSNAPHQHFAMAVLRAVENRRTLVRAANTGISGFIDPFGRITATSDLFVPAWLTESVPIMDSRTVYNRWGFLFGPGCIVAVLLTGGTIAIGQRRRQPRRSS